MEQSASLQTQPGQAKHLDLSKHEAQMDVEVQATYVVVVAAAGAAVGATFDAVAADGALEAVVVVAVLDTIADATTRLMTGRHWNRKLVANACCRPIG